MGRMSWYQQQQRRFAQPGYAAVAALTAAIVVHVFKDNNRNRRRTNADDAIIETTKNHTKIVLGLGVACVDMIATVDTFPRPDDKIRALDVDLFSGGNIGNTLTAISKLDAARTKVLTKIGNDSNGRFVLNDFAVAGIETEDVIVTSSSPTLMVYIIADSNATRTCIAAPPKEEVEPNEVLEKLGESTNRRQPTKAADILDGVTLVHLDSRHTAAAVTLAKAANQRGIPVSIDVEKDRPPHLKDLLPLCDIIFTNQHFPQVYFGSPSEQSASNTSTDRYNDDDHEVLSTLLSMKQFFSPTSRAQVVITTRGAQGALLMRRSSNHGIQQQAPTTTVPSSQQQQHGGPSMLDSTLVSMLTRDCMDVRHFTLNSPSSNSNQTSCLQPSKVTATTIVPSGRLGLGSSNSLPPDDAVFDVVRCSAWPLHPHELVDSTGAGDAFIGGFISGWLSDYSDADCMTLGSAVAAAKLGKKGARQGLPTAVEINNRIRAISSSNSRIDSSSSSSSSIIDSSK